jgi:carotenoid cleavage dioxygenase-like enzyme
MAASLPNHPQLRGNYAPINFEASYNDLVIEGTVPTDLSGSLYRIGPNPKFVKGAYHWFFGTGMVHAFHVEDGRVDYVNRWVRTPKFEREIELGHGLSLEMSINKATGQIESHRRNGVANTHIVTHGEHLLALEEGSHPFSIEPTSLASSGYGHYADGIDGAMTAHPKVDPETGELHGFGYMTDHFGSNTMTYHVIDKRGRTVRSDTFKAPYAAMVHDFMITRDYVLFPVFPLTCDLSRIDKFGFPFAFDGQAGAYIGVLARGANVSTIQWIEAPSRYIFHYLNAWNDGTRVTFDAIDFPVAPNFPNVDGSIPAHADAQGKLTRWTLDVKTGAIDRHRTLDVASEFPRIDDRFTAARHRHGYIAAASKRAKGDGGLFHEITHFDYETGNAQTWDAGLGNGVSEPVFVEARGDAKEGEGWLLATVYDPHSSTSSMVILDAERVEEGPVATAKLDHRIPYGFHGSWRQKKR